MKSLLAILAMVLCGCMTDTKDAAHSTTIRTFGVDISPTGHGPNSARITLGLSFIQFHWIPISTNQLYAAPVYSSASIRQNLTHNVTDEDFATGAAVTNINFSAESPAKLGARRPIK